MRLSFDLRIWILIFCAIYFFRWISVRSSWWTMICATKGMLYYLVALASFDELENFWAGNSKTVKISFLFCCGVWSQAEDHTFRFSFQFIFWIHFGFILNSFRHPFPKNVFAFRTWPLSVKASSKSRTYSRLFNSSKHIVADACQSYLLVVMAYPIWLVSTANERFHSN